MLLNDIIEIRKILDSDSGSENNGPLDFNFGLRVLKLTKLKMMDKVKNDGCRI